MRQWIIRFILPVFFVLSNFGTVNLSPSFSAEPSSSKLVKSTTSSLTKSATTATTGTETSIGKSPNSEPGIEFFEETWSEADTKSQSDYREAFWSQTKQIPVIIYDVHAKPGLYGSSLQHGCAAITCNESNDVYVVPGWKPDSLKDRISANANLVIDQKSLVRASMLANSSDKTISLPNTDLLFSLKDPLDGKRESKGPLECHSNTFIDANDLASRLSFGAADSDQLAILLMRQGIEPLLNMRGLVPADNPDEEIKPIVALIVQFDETSGVRHYRLVDDAASERVIAKADLHNYLALGGIGPPKPGSIEEPIYFAKFEPNPRYTLKPGWPSIDYMKFCKDQGGFCKCGASPDQSVLAITNGDWLDDVQIGFARQECGQQWERNIDSCESSRGQSQAYRTPSAELNY